MTQDLLLVATGGAIGASLRHLIAKAALMYLPTNFPWGTSLINVSGCLIIGMVAGLSNNGTIGPSTRLFVATGLLGGYTTFSAFGLETQTLIANGRLTSALQCVLGQVILGVVGVFLGLAITRRLVH